MQSNGLLRAADLFCGAGGTSTGAEASGAAKVVFAVNHWKTAVETHSSNFPHAKHVNSRIDQVNPSECGKLDILFASPECTHHSRARGGKPTSDQQRSGAWDILKWIEYHRPTWGVIENVVEFRQWGPVHNGKPMKSKKGAFFEAWIRAIQSAGYKADFQRLNAADFGARTSRERLFVIFRKGKRSPVFPDPVFTESPGNELPGLALPRWRPAYESIDWNIPCPSIFGRRRPLADKTLLRIEAGLRRFCGPFVAQWDQQSSSNGVRSVDDPLSTMVTKANQGLVLPFQVVLRNNCDAASVSDPMGVITAGGRHAGVAIPFVSQFNEGTDRRNVAPCDPLPTIRAGGKAFGLMVPFALATGSGGAPRSAGDPLPTIVTRDATAFVTPFIAGCGARDGQSPPKGVDQPLNTVVTKDAKCLVAPFIVPNFSERSGQQPRSHDVADGLPTITSHGGGNLALPFLSSYYGNGDAQSIGDPLDTITTKDRHGLCVALCRGPEDWPEPTTEAMRKLQATMKELRIADIGFRMLSNPELADAQGFPAGYIFKGNKADITRQIGNSVSPPVAEHITRAIAGV